MKLSVMQENLSKALSVVSRAVAVRTTLPITNNVLLAVEDGRLKLAATNLEIAITQWIGAKVEREGAITVPARILNEFVNSLPNGHIEIELLPRQRSLQLKCARFEARIAGVDAEEFPPLPDIDNGVTVQIDPEALRRVISRVAFAAATEDSRPVLTGVNAVLEGSTLTLAAADGYRLSVDRAPIMGNVADRIAIIIPAKAMNEVIRLMSDARDAVTMTVNAARSQVLFKSENTRLTSQLIQGTFPNYSQLIPADRATRTVVDADEFLRATKAAAIFARDASGIVRLQMTPVDAMPAAESAPKGKLMVSARAEELGDDFGEIDANVDGAEAKIAFNAKYLIDILNVLGKGEIALDTNSPSSPGVIRPLTDENFIHVVMPMYVNW